MRKRLSLFDELKPIALKTAIVFCLIGFVATLGAQRNGKELVINHQHACNYLHGYSTFRDTIALNDENLEDVALVMEEILDQVGLFSNFTLMAGDVSNAMATVAADGRYIIYDPSFFRRVRRKSSNSDYVFHAILAHEIGHHLLGHTFNSVHGSRTQRELEADYWSGFVLYKLGAKLAEAQSVIKLEAPDIAIGFYPGQEQRMKAIKNGWEKAKDQGGQPKKRRKVKANRPLTKASQPVVDKKPLEDISHSYHAPEHAYNAPPPSQEVSQSPDNKSILSNSTDSVTVDGKKMSAEDAMRKVVNSITNQARANVYYNGPDAIVSATGANVYNFFYTPRSTDDYRDSIFYLPGIKSFNYNMPGDVIIRKGDENSIRVFSDPDFLQQIGVGVRRGEATMKIRQPGTYNVYGTRVVLTVTDIDRISCSGTGSLKTDRSSPLRFNRLQIVSSGTGDVDLNVVGDYLKISKSGTGNLNLAGKVKEFDLDSGGTGDVKCLGMESKICNLSVSGAGSVHIRVSEYLSGSLGRQTKSVSYIGNPIIDLVNPHNVKLNKIRVE